MAIADISKVTARVLWLIGARSDSAVFDTTVGNDNFILEEVRRALIETESDLAQDLAESSHPMRNSFVAWSADLSNGDLIPAHLGEIDAVQIKPYSAGSFALAESATRENIRRWRENYNNVFDSINHDASGSGLAGYYNITGDTITFTGYRAQAKLFTFTPNYATPAHQVDNIFESNLVCGAIPRLLKIGVPSALTQHYENLYLQMKQSLRAGHNQMPDINDLQKVE